MDMSYSTNEFASMSASPIERSCSLEMCFYSVPNSPGRVKADALSGFLTKPTTPAYQDANSNFDEFEFDTSRRFNLTDFGIEARQKDVNPVDTQREQQQRLQRQRGEPLPTMAFADELFYDGRVLPMIPPLKLPPRLQSGNGCKMSTPSSTVSSPRSPYAVFRLPFSYQSLWNDDFDPFMVALEKVKEEKRGKSQRQHGLRRARSLSPSRGNSTKKTNKPVDLKPRSESPHGEKETQSRPAWPMSEGKKEPLKQSSRSPHMLTESKGLFARSVRLVKLGNDVPLEPHRALFPKLAMERSIGKTKKKGQRIMKILFGNASDMEKASAEHELKDQKAALGKPTISRKHSLESGGLMKSTQWDEDERMGGGTKMSESFYKPRLFLCLGYGTRYAK